MTPEALRAALGWAMFGGALATLAHMAEQRRGDGELAALACLCLVAAAGLVLAAT